MHLGYFQILYEYHKNFYDSKPLIRWRYHRFFEVKLLVLVITIYYSVGANGVMDPISLTMKY